MIEKIKNNWKMIVICVLAIALIYVIYRKNKEVFVEAPAKETLPAEAIDYEPVFADYRGGKISQKQAQAKCKLSTGSFYRKLEQYDKTHAIEGDSADV